MSEWLCGPVTLQCRQGDIANQPDLDAVVNAANAQLRTGGGVAGALHRAAGPGLAEECAPLAPIEPGQAVITGAHRLPNDHVIHALGPVYGKDTPSDRLLADGYRNALALAEAQGLTSIGFPALSTGAFGYPLEAAIQVTLDTVLSESAHLKHLRLIRFVLFSDQDLASYHQQLAARLGEPVL